MTALRKQPDMFPDAPRRKRRVMMHVVDAGMCGDTRIVVFECGGCGHRTKWTEARTVTEDKRGRPCPNCNDSQA